MIERAGKKKMLLFSGSSNSELAEKVAKELGTELAEVDKTQFANGEIYIRLQESVRGADCFCNAKSFRPSQLYNYGTAFTCRCFEKSVCKENYCCASFLSIFKTR